ncbi:MAG: Dimethylglycine N-methyltransferase [Syntrophorhabdus sp. PtaU1.Bin002]|nr:MAG: Dimethylglycine N-methyltransferase [Syntrophorhabdus sp. PtaB.Bin006]OPY70976.1 MAG: Dimethylglycine N-methyltransferase [Syntrophorhabdus sp. PtaU1.Bin002]
MKNSLMRLIACVSISLVLCGSHTVFAEEKTTQGSDTPRKMNVSGYDETARGINAPMYAYYAQKIKEKTGITKGVCIDVGSGGGYLGLALAKITDLDFIFLDISADMLEKAKLHIVEDGLQKRAKTLLADVHSIPLADGSANLVISRGSIPFWKDPAKALKEIYRVLAPGGKAYIGGGRGTPEIQAQIAAKRKELGSDRPGDKAPRDGGPGRIPQRNYDEILKATGITKYALNKGDDGMWIQMWK